MVSILYTAGLALLALAVSAAPTQSSVLTSVVQDQTCISIMRPAYTGTASSLTWTRTSVTTVSKVVTFSQTAEMSTTTITLAAVTSTKLINVTSPGAIESTGAPATTIYTTVRASNGTADDVGCDITETVSASTTTIYTGTFSSSAVRRTAAPVDLDWSIGQRDVSYARFANHQFNQAWFFRAETPFEVDCLDQVTTYLITSFAIFASNAISTVTASAPTVYVTGTQIPQHTGVAKIGASTVTSTITAGAGKDPTPKNTAVCTVTMGSASATTTQHVKCAPTNLITSLNGQGIGGVQGHDNETQGLAPGGDPSACCQLCVDTDGCAASFDAQDSGNCFLYYTSSPKCGLGFTYANSSKLAPGKGYSVQSGCGYIEPAVP